MNNYEALAEEYERFKRERINLLERAGDWFGGVDERIDFLAPRIFLLLAEVGDLRGQVSNVLEEIRKVQDALAEFPEGDGIRPMKIEMIPYSYTLAAAQGARMTELMPFSGRVIEVMIHWAEGCNALVDVRVGHGNVPFCPREGYLALNNVTPKFAFNEWVDEGAEVWVEMRNTDSVNPHTITVTVSVRGEE